MMASPNRTVNHWLHQSRCSSPARHRESRAVLLASSTLELHHQKAALCAPPGTPSGRTAISHGPGPCTRVVVPFAGAISICPRLISMRMRFSWLSPFHCWPASFWWGRVHRLIGGNALKGGPVTTPAVSFDPRQALGLVPHVSVMHWETPALSTSPPIKALPAPGVGAGWGY